MSSRIPSRSLVRFTWLLVAAGSLHATSARAAAEAPPWVARSNEHAQVLVAALAQTSPELAARIGVPGFDEYITDLSAGLEERTRRQFAAARDELVRRAAAETDAHVQQDLAILIQAANDRLETDALNDRLVVPYDDIPQLMFFGQFALLQEQVDPARRPAALVRLKRYTGLEIGTTPILDLARERYLGKPADGSRLRPFKGEVESHLAAIPSYVAGIRQLYAAFDLGKADGATAALDAMEKQLQAYADWLRTTVLPNARTDARLPAELYADNLKNVGLDLRPEELMGKAQVAFAEIRNEMQTLAPLVAKQYGLAATDYRDVVRELKKTQLTRDEVETHYREIIGELESIIRRERIVTLPQRPMRMRLGSEAENAAQRAPRFDPPPLIGARDEQGVFILTTSSPGADGTTTDFDDFTYKAGAWTLAAHEGRPGHDLQFAAMVERGVSLARSLFAFNSVNIEGWALYAEAEAKPHEPLDGQLIALQHRLMRAARAFLDPMLNLGLIDRERAREILMGEVCLSAGMAEQELDRYTFRAPGQATSYFYGYTRLMELRTATEIALGERFDRQAFNDFVVGQGLLPPDLLAKAVREGFIPAQAKRS